MTKPTDPPAPTEDAVPDDEAALEATDPSGAYPYDDEDTQQEDYS